MGQSHYLSMLADARRRHWERLPIVSGLLSEARISHNRVWVDPLGKFTDDLVHATMLAAGLRELDFDFVVDLQNSVLHGSLRTKEQLADGRAQLTKNYRLLEEILYG